jgi:CubicO group peptidase (beta-lactamase class C family)
MPLSFVMALFFAYAAPSDDPVATAVRSGQFKKITSVAISRGGQMVYESYFDGDASTLRNTRSATKTVTGMLVGIAVDHGMLSADAPVMKFFQGRDIKNRGQLKDKITVKDLLTMSSALDCNDNDEKSPGNEEGMYPHKDWVQFGLDLPVRPASGWAYCTAGVTMLAGVLEQATHMTVPEFARRNLFEPLGIANAKWSYSPAGVAMTGGGLELSTRDYVKLAQLYLNHGRAKGRQIVPETWVAASTSPQARIDDHTEYGYLWWIQDFHSGGKPFPAYYMTGNGGNKVVVFPRPDLIVVITSTNYNTKGMHQMSERLLTEYILPNYSR